MATGSMVGLAETLHPEPPRRWVGSFRTRRRRGRVRGANDSGLRELLLTLPRRAGAEEIEAGEKR